MDKNPPSQPPIPRRRLTQGPLSFSQEALWFLQQLDPENFAYNSTFIYQFTGGIDRLSLERALNEMVRRHESLRTVYPNLGGTPQQIVQPYQPFSLTFVDFSGLLAPDRQQAVNKYVSENGNLPYRLQQGPLVRFALLHTALTEDYLFWGIHHINSDAWSREIFINELMQYYKLFCSGELANLPELPIQYLDYALWQREWLSGNVLAAYIDHWKTILAGDLPVLELPTDRPRPLLQTSGGARYYFRFPPPMAAQIKDFCKRERITAFHLFLATYAILLMRYTGQEDIIVGCPFANRSRPELDGMVGVFVNTLPIRLNMQGNPLIRNFFDQVRSVMLDAFAWQAAPFESLVSEISPERDLSHTPVFQVAINMRNVPKRPPLMDGLEGKSLLREDSPAQFDISLEFDDEGDSLAASLLYNTDLYDENTIVYMVAHYQNLLRDLLGDTARPLSEVEMLSPSERKRMLIDWNETGVDFPQICVQDLVSEQAKRTPAAPAIVCNGATVTYADLETRSNRLAHHLRKNGVTAESRVGFYLPRSESTLISLLAVLKAGGGYLPLDLSLPAERIATMLTDSAPAAIITLTHLQSQLPDGFRKVCLDAEAEAISACETEAPVSVTTPDSLLYMMYTSGSTGRPKGVMNIHRGIVNYLTFMKDQFHLGPGDRFIQLTSLSFDVSLFEIMSMLSSGGTVLLMDDEQMRNPDHIWAAIVDQQATCISPVPTMLRAICESALAAGPKQHTLRLVMPAGEVLREADVELARRAFGGAVTLVNQYGPTECSIIHTTYTIPPVLPPGLQSVPIGRPIANARAYVLDRSLHPVPVGAKGELFIGGVCVGRGYWDRPELTAEKFLPDPFHPGSRMYRTGDIVRQLADGTICYLGRLDNQVKIRGYRVELGEIESVMIEFPGVREAAVVLRRKGTAETVAGYMTISEGDPEDVKASLRTHLANRLPFYMLPAELMVLDELPTTYNGKIDRRALPLTDGKTGRENFIPPRNDIEKKLVDIWKEVLGLDRLGIRDNFFELGGHSLMAVRLFTRIEKEFGKPLPLLLLFKEGTVEALAAALAGDAGSAVLSGVVPIQPEGDRTPLFIVSAGLYMRDLALALGSDRPVYALKPYEDGKLTYQDSVEQVAQIYYRCLTAFRPEGPYLLLGHSSHGIFTLELARLLRQEGKEVAFLGLLDTYPPGSWRNVKPIDRIKVHLGNLQDKDLKGVLNYLGQSARRWFTRRRVAVMGVSSVKYREKKGQGKEIVTVLVHSYQPKPFDGPVTIFSAEGRPWYVRRDPMEAWSNFITGPLEMVAIPGDHMTMFKSPQVSLLAEKIADLLRRHDTA